MQPISLYPNLKRDPELSATREVLRLLTQKGHPVLIPDSFFPRLGSDYKNLSFLPENALFERGAALITLGGDGTILSVASRAAANDIPVLGINLGNIGFMAGLEKKDLARLDKLRPRDFFVSERMMLSCTVGKKAPFYALNEIVIAPEKGFHIIELSLKADRRRLSRFRADGLIFNTPTGSTGYAFSAGGAVTDAALDCIGVKTISSYMLINAHHMIFRPETVFTAYDLKSDGGTITVCADGREAAVPEDGEKIVVKQSDKRLKLCFLGEKSNLEVFFRKF